MVLIMVQYISISLISYEPSPNNHIHHQMISPKGNHHLMEWNGDILSGLVLIRMFFTSQCPLFIFF